MYILHSKDSGTSHCELSILWTQYKKPLLSIKDMPFKEPTHTANTFTSIYSGNLSIEDKMGRSQSVHTNYTVHSKNFSMDLNYVETTLYIFSSLVTIRVCVCV